MFSKLRLNLIKNTLNKNLSISCEHLKIEHKQHGEYLVLTLNKPPVNSFDLKFTNELISTLDEIEKDKKIKGAIITSV